MKLLLAALFASGTVACHGAVYLWNDPSPDTRRGSPNADLLALNHFDTGGQTVLITRIGVLWYPLANTVSPTLALYSDPNGDGIPSDVVPLLLNPITIAPNVVIENTRLQWYSISPTLVSGSFFVGAFLSDRNSSFDPGIAIDLSHAGPNRSWIIENATVGRMNLKFPWATSTLRARLEMYMNGNHFIQAQYVVVPEPSSAALLVLAAACFGMRAARKPGRHR